MTARRWRCLPARGAMGVLPMVKIDALMPARWDRLDVQRALRQYHGLVVDAVPVGHHQSVADRPPPRAA